MTTMESTDGRLLRGQRSRVAIIAAARELFLIKGFHATSNEEIAALAGVGTRGAVNHHFKSKEELFEAVVDAVEADLVARAEQLVLTSQGDVWEQFVSTLRGFLHATLEPDVQRIILIDGPAVLGWQRWHDNKTRYGLASTERQISAAMKAGLLRKGPTRALTHMVLAAIDEAALFIAHAPNQKAAMDEAVGSLTMLLTGLRKEQGA